MSDVTFDGLADSAQDSMERDLKVAIDEVLHALPKGESTGVCKDCGADIEAPRLALLPGTTHCAACALRRTRLVPIAN